MALEPGNPSCVLAVGDSSHTYQSSEDTLGVLCHTGWHPHALLTCLDVASCVVLYLSTFRPTCRLVMHQPPRPSPRLSSVCRKPALTRHKSFSTLQVCFPPSPPSFPPPLSRDLRQASVVLHAVVSSVEMHVVVLAVCMATVHWCCVHCMLHIAAVCVCALALHAVMLVPWGRVCNRPTWQVAG